MNRTLVLIGGVLALIGLIVNIVLDFDSMYDVATFVLWVLTLIFVFAGAFAGGKKPAAPATQ